MIRIVDYGRGNLFSINQAIRHLGHKCEISDDPGAIAAAERVILPGVGAFGDGMADLRRKALDGAVRSAAEQGTPVLGICLGMQMLATASEEFGHHEGLGLIPGHVRRLPADAGGEERIPNVGWRTLHISSDNLMRAASDQMVYFVHSYAMDCINAESVAATFDFTGRPVTAAVMRGNVVGYQFHPEKSGPVGLALLQAFLQIPERRRGV